MQNSKVKKIISVLVVAISGEKTIKVARTVVKENTLYKVRFNKTQSFLVHATEDDIKKIKENKIIEFKVPVKVEINCRKISKKKSSVFVGFSN